MCGVKPDKRIVHSIALSNTRSKLKRSINLIKIIIKNIRILKIFIFESMTKSLSYSLWFREYIFGKKFKIA
jgi:hypothetical protein